MNYYRASYLPTAIQASVYNELSWPRNTLRSFAPRAREGYARTNVSSSYAPRVPSTVRQSAPTPVVMAAPDLGKLVAA